jgi:hypothetical protein
MGLNTKTYWLTDRKSQCDFDFDFDLRHSQLASDFDKQSQSASDSSGE